MNIQNLPLVFLFLLLFILLDLYVLPASQGEMLKADEGKSATRLEFPIVEGSMMRPRASILRLHDLSSAFESGEMEGLPKIVKYINQDK